jgi:hypothetical protein
VLLVEAVEGPGASRHAIRVKGGQGQAGEHNVDPTSVTSANGAIGHLTRVIVEQAKMLAKNATDAMQSRTDALKELERTRREAMRGGKYAVEAQVVALQAEDARESRKAWGDAVRGLSPLAHAVVARFSPAGKDAAWAKFKEGLSDEQLAELGTILGETELARAMSFASADAACAYLYKRVDQPTFVAIAQLLTEEQRTVFGAAMQEEAKRQEAAEKEKTQKSAAEGAAQTEQTT